MIVRSNAEKIQVVDAGGVVMLEVSDYGNGPVVGMSTVVPLDITKAHEMVKAFSDALYQAKARWNGGGQQTN